VSAETLLADGLAALQLSGMAGLRDRLLAYLRLLEKWNRTYNLSAVREPEKMVTQHLLDSLSVLPHLHGTRLIDVGAGAGLPGIPLALARNDLQVALLDANQKKAAFMTQTLAELRLDNAAVVNRRIEDYRPGQPFDTVITRAFSDLQSFFGSTCHLGSRGTRWLAMKGVHPDEELAQLGRAARVIEVARIAVPGMDAERCLVIMEATDA
jgi:16S rRNA (guanine527-N7)-methyltransferase